MVRKCCREVRAGVAETYQHPQCGYQGDDLHDAPEGEEESGNHVEGCD